jgi:hypothetical protein
MADKDDILRRLERVERENQRLKQELAKAGKSKSGTTKPDHVTVYESEYQGHPVIKFSIGKRFFSMGLRRLAAVLAAKDLIVDFVKRHDAALLEWKAEHGGVAEEDKDEGDVGDVKI